MEETGSKQQRKVWRVKDRNIKNEKKVFRTPFFQTSLLGYTFFCFSDNNSEHTYLL